MPRQNAQNSAFASSFAEAAVLGFPRKPNGIWIAGLANSEKCSRGYPAQNVIIEPAASVEDAVAARLRTSRFCNIWRRKELTGTFQVTATMEARLRVYRRTDLPFPVQRVTGFLLRIPPEKRLVAQPRTGRKEDRPHHQTPTASEAF